jgi:hypothetical protein
MAIELRHYRHSVDIAAKVYRSIEDRMPRVLSTLCTEDFKKTGCA